MALKIDWEGLIVGFESRSQQITHFFDRETGDVEQALVKDADRHRGFESDARFLALPRDGGERTLGDLDGFLAVCEDEACRRALGESLLSDAPAPAYRKALLQFPKEEARFFQFKEHRALERAQAWLAEQGIPFRKPDGPLEM